MKFASLLLLVMLSVSAMGQSIKDSKVLVYKYSIDIDENIVKASEEKTTGKSFIGGFGSASTNFYEDYAGKKTEYNGNGGNKLTASLIDTLYYISNTILKSKFNATCLPLDELGTKVKYAYHDPYKVLPDITLKIAKKYTTGYASFGKLSISIQRQGVGIGNGVVGVGSTKAVIFVSLEIYDKDGNKLKDVKGEAKGEESIISSVNVGSDIKLGVSKLVVVRTHLSMLYGKAFNDLISKIVE